jgi:uncharacterized membrane-anchored protein
MMQSSHIKARSGLARGLAHTAALIFILAGVAFPAQAQSDTNLLAKVQALKALESSLHYQQGQITLKSGLATISLPDAFRYLSPVDAETVLFKIWGNPPGAKPLGMIVPAGMSILSPSSWAVIITYNNDGYVKDADAGKIDYSGLLQKMQEATREASKKRVEQHYPSMELVGWAAPPVYDKDTHKMYWAKEIHFGDSKHNTLNYNIRVLGRHGVLVLNAVAPMDIFPQIQEQTPDVVKMVDFTEGNRYADFNHSTDKVAAYGLAALVVGGIAAKAGFFKILLVGLLAAKKFIIIGLIAFASFFKKIFKRKPPASSPPSTPAL